MLSRHIASRALLMRTLKNMADNVKIARRNAGHGVWTYRVPPPLPPKSSIIVANVVGGLAWYWILYHCVTEPEHIFGHYPYVDPSTYTDEELGIPPDAAGPLKK